MKEGKNPHAGPVDIPPTAYQIGGNDHIKIELNYGILSLRRFNEFSRKLPRVKPSGISETTRGGISVPLCILVVALRASWASKRLAGAGMYQPLERNLFTRRLHLAGARFDVGAQARTTSWDGKRALLAMLCFTIRDAQMPVGVEGEHHAVREVSTLPAVVEVPSSTTRIKPRAGTLLAAARWTNIFRLMQKVVLEYLSLLILSTNYYPGEMNISSSTTSQQHLSAELLFRNCSAA